MSKEIDAESCQFIFHGNELLVMDGIVMLNRLQLTRLISNDALGAIAIPLHQRTADCEIAGVANHMKWSVRVRNRQHRRFHQALLDSFKETRTFSEDTLLQVGVQLVLAHPREHLAQVEQRDTTVE